MHLGNLEGNDRDSLGASRLCATAACKNPSKESRMRRIVLLTGLFGHRVPWNPVHPHLGGQRRAVLG